MCQIIQISQDGLGFFSLVDILRVNASDQLRSKLNGVEQATLSFLTTGILIKSKIVKLLKCAGAELYLTFILYS